MSCEYTQEQLESYVMGILDDKEEHEVASHVKSCDGCRARLALLTQATRMLHDAFDEPPPEWLSQKTMYILKNTPKRSFISWVPWGVPALAGITVILLVLFIQPGIILKPHISSIALRSSRIAIPPVQKQTVETGVPASMPAVASRLLPEVTEVTEAFVDITDELNINLKNPVDDRSIYDGLGVKKEVAKLLL